MNKITAGDKVDASWVDPKTGDSVSIGSFSNTGIESFSTPDGWEDAILILKAPAGRKSSTRPNSNEFLIV
ncbi:MAG: hypothetical protein A2Z38_08305 [Planctomycetes bacterium RBG_19FT_COMBO_48_8]|nr:MAG: hypothetical protein A2Z38_08305 [Planctomycetes bacterium RBG_19FT_COMBO_48_8]